MLLVRTDVNELEMRVMLSKAPPPLKAKSFWAFHFCVDLVEESRLVDAESCLEKTCGGVDSIAGERKLP